MLANKKQDDQREFLRMNVKVDCPVCIESIDGSKIGSGKVLNLSGSGIAILAETPFDLDSKLVLELTPPMPVAQNMRARVNVVRVDGHESGMHSVAVAIEEFLS